MNSIPGLGVLNFLLMKSQGVCRPADGYRYWSQDAGCHNEEGCGNTYGVVCFP